MVKTLNISNGHFTKIYLIPSIYLSILLCIDKFKSWYLYNFLSIYACIYEKGSLIYEDGYVKMFYETTHPQKLERYFNIYPIKELCSSFIREMVVNAIDENKYMIIDIDEYFISNTYYYKRVHYYRQFLIYGYDSDKDCIMAMSHNKRTEFKEFIISFDELKYILDYQKNNHQIANQSKNAGFFVFLKENNWISTELNYELFYENFQKNNLNEVIFEKENNTKTILVKGFNYYDVIIEAFNKQISNIEKIDYRTLAVMFEHKDGLLQRLNYLKEKYHLYELSSCIQKYTLIHAALKSLFLRVIRPYYDDFSKKRAMLNEVIKELKNIKESDQKAVNDTLYILGQR